MFWEASQRTRHSWRNNLQSGSCANGNSPKETPKEKTRNCTYYLRTVGEVAILSIALWSQNQSYWLFCVVWLDFSVFDLFLSYLFSHFVFQKFVCSYFSQMCCWYSCRWQRAHKAALFRSRLNYQRPGEPDSVNPAAVHCAPWPRIKRKPIA